MLLFALLAPVLGLPQREAHRAITPDLQGQLHALLADISAAMDADRAALEFAHNYRLHMKPRLPNSGLALISEQGATTADKQQRTALGGRVKNWHLAPSAGVGSVDISLLAARPSAALVVARANETIDWMAPTLASGNWDEVNFFLCPTGRHDVPSASAGMQLSSFVPANIGREAFKYLGFIIDRYDNLPDNIMFIQAGGEINGYSDLPDRNAVLENWKWSDFPTDAGHMSFLTVHCGPYLGASQFNSNESFFKWVVGDVYPHPFEYQTPCCSEFGVNRPAIIGRPKTFWQNALKQGMRMIDTHVGMGKSRHTAEWNAGWTFEMAWRIMFKTADLPTPEMFAAHNLATDGNGVTHLKSELLPDSVKHCTCGGGGQAKCGKDCCQEY